MKTKTRALNGITKRKEFKIDSVEQRSYEIHELPMLTTRDYVFDHRRVTEHKRKLNKELIKALKVVKKYEFE